MPFELSSKMVEQLKGNIAVLGVILMGSASLDVQDEQSDIDLLIIYEGDTEPPIEFPKASWKWDVSFETLDQLRNIHQSDWRSHAFLSAKVLYDNTNQIPEVIQNIITVPADNRINRVEGSLDAYLNAFYRSMKSSRRGNRLGTLIHAGDSVRFLSNCLFIMNGLIPPYPDRILVTLDMLSNLPLPPSKLHEQFTSVVEGDPVNQSRLFKIVEEFFRNHGLGKVYDAWGEKLKDELVG